MAIAMEPLTTSDKLNVGSSASSIGGDSVGTWIRKMITIGDDSKAVTLPADWIRSQFERLKTENVYLAIRSATQLRRGESIDFLIIECVKK